VKACGALASGTAVELCTEPAEGPCRQTGLNNGRFRFDSVMQGRYVVKITAPDGRPLKKQYVQVQGFSTELSIELPAVAGARPVSGTVSVKQLQRAVPKKALRAFRDSVKLTENKRYDEAAEKLREAVAIYPDYAEAHNDLGVQYIRRGDNRAAAAEFGRAAALEPSPAVYSNLSCALASLGQYDEAESVLRSALRADPGFGKGHFLLGRVLEIKGRNRESLEHLSFAARALPRALLSMARIHLREHNTGAAEQELKEYVERVPGDRKTAESLLASLGR
jgi:tetratricopeptide (TPR) repeat protein